MQSPVPAHIRQMTAMSKAGPQIVSVLLSSEEECSTNTWGKAVGPKGSG